MTVVPEVLVSEFVVKSIVLLGETGLAGETAAEDEGETRPPVVRGTVAFTAVERVTTKV